MAKKKTTSASKTRGGTAKTAARAKPKTKSAAKSKTSRPAAAKTAAKTGAKAAPKKTAPSKTTGAVKAKADAGAKRKGLSVKDLRKYRGVLLALHDQISGRISFLARDNLNQSGRDSSGDLSRYSTHMADQGTDNFDRELALSLVSTEQDALFEIDDAIQRIDAGEYGICESCGEEIEPGRLQAIPFARNCVACQSANERGKPRFRNVESGISQNVNKMASNGAPENVEES
ncbi:MAG: TraR/DksA C4-type zinc finger protein [Kiritimatiellae bacterium]|nr:TraR/DksA C4-type zinc finger protein [Kiritimatiellia bacterium]